MTDVLNEGSYQVGNDDEDNCSAVNTHLVDLREAFIAALTASGVLGKLRAQLRVSAIALLRKDEELCHTAVGSVRPPSKLSFETKLTMLLVHQFLQSAGMHSTAGVFEAEGALANVDEDGQVREVMQTCMASYTPLPAESNQAPALAETTTVRVTHHNSPHVEDNVEASAAELSKRAVTSDTIRTEDVEQEAPCSVLEYVVRDALMHSKRGTSLTRSSSSASSVSSTLVKAAAHNFLDSRAVGTRAGGARTTTSGGMLAPMLHSVTDANKEVTARGHNKTDVPTSEAVQHSRVPRGEGGGAYSAEPADYAVMCALKEYEESIPFSDKEGPLNDEDVFDVVESVDVL